MKPSSEHPLASALYCGRVRHRRRGPRPHAFDVRLYLAYLDLDELERAFEGSWLWSVRRPAVSWFRRADYLGDPAVPLKSAVRARVAEALGAAPDGPVRILTQLRTWGWSFNPVSFYFCFEADGETLAAVVAEITNTPWNERHAYVLDARRARRRGPWHVWRFAKDFHVSPFLPMELDYRWRFRAPGAHLAVCMDDLARGADAALFDARLVLRRRALTPANLRRVLVTHPWMPLRTSFSIYWHALRLWAKRTPFFVHPDKRTAPRLPRPSERSR